MKKGLMVMLSIMMLLPVLNLTVFGASNFQDIQNHWAKGNIESLIQQGIINGYPDGTFKPDNNVNVDAFIKMAVTALGYNLENGSTYWASTYLEKAKDVGLVKNGEFTDYTRPINRAEMARIITRALDETFAENLDDYKQLIGDYSSIHNEFKDYIVKAYSKGIISGYPDGTFKPKQQATRAEAATMIIRLLKPEERKVPTLPKKIPTSTTEIKELVYSLPSFKGNTTWSVTGQATGAEGTLLVNLKGTDVFEDNTISFIAFNEERTMVDIDVKYKYVIQIYKTELTADEKAFLEDFLQVYYPTSYKKIMQSLVNKESILTTYDNRGLYLKIYNSGIKIRIGE